MIFSIFVHWRCTVRSNSSWVEKERKMLNRRNKSFKSTIFLDISCMCLGLKGFSKVPDKRIALFETFQFQAKRNPKIFSYKLIRLNWIHWQRKCHRMWIELNGTAKLLNVSFVYYSSFHRYILFKKQNKCPVFRFLLRSVHYLDWTSWFLDTIELKYAMIILRPLYCLFLLNKSSISFYVFFSEISHLSRLNGLKRKQIE